MKLSFCIILCIIILAVCFTKKRTNFYKLEGTYSGTFQRINLSGSEISNVLIIFSAKGWSGQSQYETYPALCNGTYKTIGNDSIRFSNNCAFTKNIDSSLILLNDYKIVFIGDNTIELSRDYYNTERDIYILTKQK